MCCGYRIPQPNEPILVVFCRQCLTYWYFGVHSKVRSAFLSCARPCRRTWSAFPAEIWTSTMLIPTFAAVQGWVSRQNWWTTDLHQILKGALLRMEISEDLPCINNMPICNANVQSFSIFEAATLRLEPLAHVSLATTQRPSRDCIWHWSAGGAGGWMVRMVVIWRPLRGGGGKRWCPHCRLSEGFQQNGTCGSWIAKWYIGRGVAYIYIYIHMAWGSNMFQHCQHLDFFESKGQIMIWVTWPVHACCMRNRFSPCWRPSMRWRAQDGSTNLQTWQADEQLEGCSALSRIFLSVLLRLLLY